MRLRRLLTHAGPGIVILACSIGTSGCNGSSAQQSQPKVDTQQAATAKPTEKPDAAKSKPVAEVENSVYDFGTMEVGEQRDHEFTVRNIGSAKLVMEKGKPGCKCTSFEVDKLELEPGESTTAKVSWRIEKVMENFEQYAPLKTNDPDHEEVRLTIKGAVAQLFQIKPSLVWRTGPLGEPVKVTGTIASSVLDKFEISKIESSNPLLTAKYKPFEEAELNSEEMKAAGIKSGYTIEADIAAGVPVGDFQSTLTIETTAREGASVSIDVVGNRPSVLRIIGQNWVQEHMMVSMGTFPAKDGKKVALNLFYTGEAELKFDDIVADPPFIQTTLERDTAFAGKGKAQKYKLTFVVPPGERPESRNSSGRMGSVKVKTNSPDVGDIKFLVNFVSIQ